MMLAEPTPTAYDIRFEIFGFPVRVTPFFWVAAAVIGWNVASSLGRAGIPNNPGQAVFLMLWMAAMFVSILIHELGHAFAMRYYGMSATIVLYHFGGLAIPGTSSSFSAFGGSWKFSRRQDQLIISAAGPAAQLALAGIVVVIVELAGYSVADSIWPLNRVLPPSDKPILHPLTLYAAVAFLTGPSVYWALLNLLPVYPLDGGQIARELFLRFGSQNAIRDSLSLSLFTAIGAALYSYSTGNPFLAMLFISLAISSYQLLQMTRYGPW